jgi:hypothetical protein
MIIKELKKYKSDNNKSENNKSEKNVKLNNEKLKQLDDINNNKVK